MDGFQLAKDFEKGTLCGWAEMRQPGLLKKHFAVMGNPNTYNQKRSAGNKGMHLHRIVRKLLGKDTPNYPQAIGDCTSFGAKNATEYVTCTEILGNVLKQAAEQEINEDDLIKTMDLKFRSVFPPFIYGASRVWIGHGQFGYYDDGSLGTWVAEAVQKYGILFSDEEGVPQYSGKVAQQWGYYDKLLEPWKDKASKHLVKKTQQITSWEDLLNAICNDLCPCATASDVGYNMEASSDGFHRQTTNWGHQMCFISAFDDGKTEPYAIILNNWGDVHGHLKDFETGEDLPVGVLRVRKADAMKHINAGETYAYGDFDGEKADLIDKSLFRIMG